MAYEGGKLIVKIVDAKKLRAANESGSSNPYVSLAVGFRPKASSGTLLETKVIHKTQNPKWNETFEVGGEFEDLCRAPLRVTVFSDKTDEGGEWQ